MVGSCLALDDDDGQMAQATRAHRVAFVAAAEASNRSADPPAEVAQVDDGARVQQEYLALVQATPRDTEAAVAAAVVAGGKRRRPAAAAVGEAALWQRLQEAASDASDAGGPWARLLDSVERCPRVLERRDAHGWTWVMMLAAGNRAAALEMLGQRLRGLPQADRDRKGRTALDIAVAAGAEAAAAVLQKQLARGQDARRRLDAKVGEGGEEDDDADADARRGGGGDGAAG